MIKEQNVENRPCSMGIPQNIAAAICYVGSFVTGIAFFFLEKDNSFVRYSAVQSVIIGIGWIAVSTTLSVLGVFISPLDFINSALSFLFVVGHVYLGYRAYNNISVQLPVIGDWVKSFVNSHPHR